MALSKRAARVYAKQDERRARVRERIRDELGLLAEELQQEGLGTIKVLESAEAIHVEASTFGNWETICRVTF